MNVIVLQTPVLSPLVFIIFAKLMNKSLRSQKVSTFVSKNTLAVAQKYPENVSLLYLKCEQYQCFPVILTR